MLVLAAEAHSDAPPLLPKLGKVAAERRRRPLTVFFGVMVGLIIFSTSSRWSASSGAHEAFFLAAITLSTIGSLGRIWSNLFISGYKSKDLVRTGPYSMCRNPLYFFSAVGMVGIGLATNTLAVPVFLIAFFAIYYPMIISREERRLAQRHPGFAEYCQRTPAFWPSLAHYEEPDTYMMYPRAMRKNLADAFWFIALAAIVHIEANVQSMHILPQMFQLW